MFSFVLFLDSASKKKPVMGNKRKKEKKASSFNWILSGYDKIDLVFNGFYNTSNTVYLKCTKIITDSTFLLHKIRSKMKKICRFALRFNGDHFSRVIQKFHHSISIRFRSRPWLDWCSMSGFKFQMTSQLTLEYFGLQRRSTQ